MGRGSSSRASACSRSAIRSSTCSMPIDSRIRFVGDRALRSFDRLPVLGQAFDAAKRCGGNDHLEAGAHAASHRRELAFDEERQHAAEAVRHLAPGDGMARMRGEARIEHALDPRMLLEMRARSPARCSKPAGSAQRAVSHAAHQQPSIRAAPSGAPILVRSARSSFQRSFTSRVTRAPASTSRMAVQIFCRRMEDDVGPKLPAAGRHRGRRGRVDGEDRARSCGICAAARCRSRPRSG